MSVTQEDYSRVWSVYELLTPRPAELLNPDRYYVREGRMFLLDNKNKKRSKRYIFLFNDVLLITKKEGSRKFWLKIYINLNPETVSVVSNTDYDPTSFSLVCRQRTFHFFTEGPADSWVRDITTSLNGKSSSSKKKSKKKVENGQSKKPKSTFTHQAPPEHNLRSNSSFRSKEFTDAFDNKVHFDSGIKLKGVKPASSTESNEVIPMLAPPPQSSTTQNYSYSTQQFREPQNFGQPQVQPTSGQSQMQTQQYQQTRSSNDINNDLLSLDFSTPSSQPSNSLYQPQYQSNQGQTFHPFQQQSQQVQQQPQFQNPFQQPQTYQSTQQPNPFQQQTYQPQNFQSQQQQTYQSSQQPNPFQQQNQNETQMSNYNTLQSQYFGQTSNTSSMNTSPQQVHNPFTSNGHYNNQSQNNPFSNDQSFTIF